MRNWQTVENVFIVQSLLIWETVETRVVSQPKMTMLSSFYLLGDTTIYWNADDLKVIDCGNYETDNYYILELTPEDFRQEALVNKFR